MAQGEKSATYGEAEEEEVEENKRDVGVEKEAHKKSECSWQSLV